MTVEKVVGREVIIYFDGTRCIHARNCVLERPDVFVPNVEGEWIHPDRATSAEIALLAHNCPSGAIRYERVDGAAAETAPKVNAVRMRENGPLAVHAPLRVDGKEQGYRAALCRCGHSRNKPFCDARHVSEGFTASGETTVKDSQPLAKRDGALNVAAVKDGPLHAQGNLEVVTGTGKTVNRVEEAWLCRCGHSQNKPYCDGSHAKVGFKSDS